jgi:hypothetical protein
MCFPALRIQILKTIMVANHIQKYKSLVPIPIDLNWLAQALDVHPRPLCSATIRTLLGRPNPEILEPILCWRPVEAVWGRDPSFLFEVGAPILHDLIYSEYYPAPSCFPGCRASDLCMRDWCQRRLALPAEGARGGMSLEHVRKAAHYSVQKLVPIISFSQALALNCGYNCKRLCHLCSGNVSWLLICWVSQTRGPKNLNYAGVKWIWGPPKLKWSWCQISLL